jgi:hypothetical protein
MDHLPIWQVVISIDVKAQSDHNTIWSGSGTLQWMEWFLLGKKISDKVSAMEKEEL